MGFVKLEERLTKESREVLCEEMDLMPAEWLNDDGAKEEDESTTIVDRDKKIEPNDYDMALLEGALLNDATLTRLRT
uniref:Uncharacterized protein n=1 Tax=Cannabis sativa TaxID=3483 RepID=A0A803Q0F4_CANSA